MQEGTYVYLLWETSDANKLAPFLHGIYSNRPDAEADAETMQADIDENKYRTNMSVTAMIVDTKPVA